LQKRSDLELHRQFAIRRRHLPEEFIRLGYARATENVTITNCQVSGYDEGSLLDGTYKRAFRNQNGTFSPTAALSSAPSPTAGLRILRFQIAFLNIVADWRWRRLMADYSKT